MAKTEAPLLSFGGSGSIAKTVVYSKWKGINYARRHVTPANPQTNSQMFVRRTFALLREMWKLSPTLAVAPWESFAEGRPFTGMNKYIGENIRVLNGETDMENFIGSPGSRGGLPPLSVEIAAPPGPGAIAVDVTPPSQIPEGWVLDAAVAMAFANQAPDGIFQPPIVVDEDDTAPYIVELSGFEPDVEVVYSAWLRWTKPNNFTAYSVGVTGLTTTGT